MPNEINDIINIEIKFRGVSLNLTSLKRTSTLGYLKSIIYEQTSVSPENQKLLGLRPSPGHDMSDMLTFNDILLPSNSKVMLIGSTEEQIKSVTTVKVDSVDDINDDLDCEEIDIEISQRHEYIAKIDRRIKEYKITTLEKPRKDSKLLILDIDYTIFDHRSTAENVRDLMRPFLHEFLKDVYPSYDIGIWSATGITWIRTKLCEMGIISKSTNQALAYPEGREHHNNIVYDDTVSSDEMANQFKICLILDQGAMISVHFPDEGVKEVKPLRVIWDNFPQWGPHNTIMFDDIRRNFIMNPQSGLKIKAYKNAYRSREDDRELLDLANYLLSIINVDNFATLNHKKWRRYMDNNRPNSCKRAKRE